ncbi:hypothetical protein [Micromonospora sp. CA-246542]|uniref:hypothetical protein n=1 Tax=Micromonospora sp. CA-246542 TaxID=3239959 RepID=UPI003D8D1B63
MINAAATVRLSRNTVDAHLVAMTEKQVTEDLRVDGKTVHIRNDDVCKADGGTVERSLKASLRDSPRASWVSEIAQAFDESIRPARAWYRIDSRLFPGPGRASRQW